VPKGLRLQAGSASEPRPEGDGPGLVASEEVRKAALEESDLFVPCLATEMLKVSEGAFMNNDILAGNWKQFKGNMLEQWGKLTDDDLDVAAGKRDQLVGKVQEKYGLAKDEAERQVKAFEDRHAKP